MGGLFSRNKVEKVIVKSGTPPGVLTMMDQWRTNPDTMRSERVIKRQLWNQSKIGEHVMRTGGTNMQLKRAPPNSVAV